MWTALEGVTVASRYELRAHLATGGMAAVFRGWDHRLCRPVAVKVLHQLEGAGDSAIERFRREARSTATLQSPHIVEVYDFFRDNGCYYLVMELVEGSNLKEHLARQGPLAPQEAFPIAIQVCRALQAAHTHGYIHRDIKPQNILLDPSGQAKLADFGIVHIPRAHRFTTSGMVLGTADYISPEQAQGEPLAPTTDIYSLGVVLYEMLTAMLPFTGTTPVSVALQHAEAPVPPLRSIRPEIPASVERVVMRALAKEPARRYPSARAMAATLEQTLAALEMAGASPGDADGHTHYVHPIVQHASTDEWRLLAERLREREAITAPAAVIQPVDGGSSAQVEKQAYPVGENVARVLPSFLTDWLGPVRGMMPSMQWQLPARPAQRLLVTAGVALLFLFGILALHLLV
jgi:serine/threonine protein kinase